MKKTKDKQMKIDSGNKGYMRMKEEDYTASTIQVYIRTFVNFISGFADMIQLTWLRKVIEISVNHNFTCNGR